MDPHLVAEAEAAARTQYASRWLEITHYVEPIPVPFPLTRMQIMILLHRAGEAERNDGQEPSCD